MTNSASDRASSWQRMLADARGAASVAEAREQLPSPLPRMLTGRRESRSRSATFGYWSTASEGDGPLPVGPGVEGEAVGRWLPLDRAACPTSPTAMAMTISHGLAR